MLHRKVFSIGLIAVLGSLVNCTLCFADTPPPPSIEKTFAELKALAIEKSPDVQIARTTAEQKNFQVWTAVARWAPGVTLQTSYLDSLNNSLLTNGSLGDIASFDNGLFKPVETRLYNWNLNLNFPIYKRSVQLALEQALAERHIAGAQVDSKLTELDWHLRQLLGAFLVQAYREETVKNSLDIAQTNLRDAKLRFDLGQNTKVDVLRAQANLLSLQSKGVTYHQQRIAALADFLEYSGLTREDLTQIQFDPMSVNEATIVHFIEDFTGVDQTLAILQPYLADDAETEKKRNQTVVESSPNYKNYLYQEDLSAAQAKNLNAAELPDLSFQANANNQAGSLPSAFQNGSTLSWSMGIYLNIPLNPGLSLLSSAMQTFRGIRAATLQREKDVQHFKNEIENDRIRIDALAKSLESLKLNVAQQEEIARLSEKSYRLGKSTIVDLLGSENDLTDSKINLAQTRVDLSVLVRKMAWNLGVTTE